MKEFENEVGTMGLMRETGNEDKVYWALLEAADAGIGAAEVRRLQLWLENNHLSAREFWEKVAQYGRLVGWKPERIGLVAKFAQEWTAERMLQYLEEREIRLVSVTERAYPTLLRFIPDFAPVLYYRGEIGVLSRVGLAVVGARKVTDYGQAAVKTLLTGEIKRLTIISGMMVGVDELAHERALAIGAPTAAFLGYGLDLVWPERVASLKERIVASGGVLVSEFAPWWEPLAKRFPMRNRLVAGSSAATLVVEAAVKSGSLITANLALDYGREVMAVPGSIFSEMSVGTLDLIKKGAWPVTTSADVMSVVQGNKVSLVDGSFYAGLTADQLEVPMAGETAPAVTEEKHFGDEWQDKVYAQIARGKCDTEELLVRCGGESQVQTALGLLELMGEIEQGGDRRWRVR